MSERNNKITLSSLKQSKKDGNRIACLTAYDSTFARVLEKSGIELLLVGDSLGMVVQGRDTTVAVTVDDMVYHCACVSRSVKRPLLMADMPFMSYASVDDALKNATALMQRGGAHIVKLESSGHQAKIISELSACGIPVCAHLGLRPQWIHKLGDYSLQAKNKSEAENLVHDAEILANAGADIFLLECVPASLGWKLSSEFEIPVIGIGAGPGCDGQILVTQDMLGISHYLPRFAKDFLQGQDSIEKAVCTYIEAVKDGTFPGTDNSYN